MVQVFTVYPSLHHCQNTYSNFIIFYSFKNNYKHIYDVLFGVYNVGRKKDYYYLEVIIYYF